MLVARLPSNKRIQPTPLRVDKIGGILMLEIGSIVFPIYRGGAANAQTVTSMTGLTPLV